MTNDFDVHIVDDRYSTADGFHDWFCSTYDPEHVYRNLPPKTLAAMARMNGMTAKDCEFYLMRIENGTSEVKKSAWRQLVRFINPKTRRKQ